MKHKRDLSAPLASVRRGRGRPPALDKQCVEQLLRIVQESPSATLEQARLELNARCGIDVCATTVRKSLRIAGVKRVKPPRTPPAQPADGDKRYGYKPSHRPEPLAGGYSTSLTDAEWELVADLFERPPGGRGMPARINRRVLLDACSYVVRTGCAWRLLPKSFPPWETVYRAFSRWAAKGTFEQMHDRLRQQWRDRTGRTPTPSAAVLDAQSTRSSPQGGQVGFDAGKKVKGRKRHVLVDTTGLMLALIITAASVQDRDAASSVLAQAQAKVTTLRKLYVDSAYSGQCAQALHSQYSIDVEVVRNPKDGNARVFHQPETQAQPQSLPSGFTPLPKRWVVERTHAWIERSRRLTMHHDRSLINAAAWVWLTQARILTRRLAA